LSGKKKRRKKLTNPLVLTRPKEKLLVFDMRFDKFGGHFYVGDVPATFPIRCNSSRNGRERENSPIRATRFAEQRCIRNAACRLNSSARCWVRRAERQIKGRYMLGRSPMSFLCVFPSLNDSL
jgi:hypothetical protein